MANICDNMLYLSTSSKENYSKLVERIQKGFECYNVSELTENESCEIDFESKWTFPHKEFKKLTDEIGQDDSLYIRVLSYEFGCEYVGFNIYRDGEWTNKLCD